MKPEVWDQLKNKTADELIGALKRDGWILRESSGSSRQIYIKGQRLVSIHYHSHKTYDPKTLRYLINEVGWNEQGLRRLKLIK